MYLGFDVETSRTVYVLLPQDGPNSFTAWAHDSTGSSVGHWGLYCSQAESLSVLNTTATDTLVHPASLLTGLMSIIKVFS